MRIISKKHDYYDRVQQYGQDDITYIRTEQKIQINYNGHDLYYSLGRYGYEGVVLSEGLIGFCGKLYPYVSISCTGKKIYCYTIDVVDQYLEKNYPKTIDEFLLKKYRYSRIRYNFRGKTSIRDFVEAYLKYFSVPENQKELKEITKYFDMAPIFSVHKAGYKEGFVHLNCLLRPYEFYRVLDVQRTFQELQMWMSNIAKPIKPIPHIDDVTMAEAKGYDKFSFRKEKSK